MSEAHETTLEPPSDGPLAGLQVIELGTILAASFATRMLADLGATVVKIETPDRPDPMRYWGRGTYRDRSLWWPIQVRNKKLISLNLRSERGAELMRDLCARTDVVIENFRPGTLERWGLGYDELSARNPGLILARISGFGQTGPYARRPGYAAVGEAMGGLRYVNGFPDLPPPRSGLSIGDSLAGLFAAQGVLAALHERSHSGLGQVIDASLTESCIAMMESSFAEYDRLGVERQPSGTSLPGVSPSNLFRSRDGAWIVIAANQDQIFTRLCAAMGRLELATDPRFDSHVARADNQVEIEKIVAEWVAEHDAAEIDRILVEAEVAAGPVYSVGQVMSDPHFKEREAFVTHSDDELGEFVAQSVFPRMSRTPGRVRWSGKWPVGADNREIFGWLGLKDDDLETLRGDGIV